MVTWATIFFWVLTVKWFWYLLQTPHYYRQFALSLGKESTHIISTFKLLNMDTLIILTVSMVPLVLIGFDQKHITLNGKICFWFDITCENFSHSAYLLYFLKSPLLPISGSIVALSQQCHITRIWAKKTSGPSCSNVGEPYSLDKSLSSE